MLRLEVLDDKAVAQYAARIPGLEQEQEENTARRRALRQQAMLLRRKNDALARRRKQQGLGAGAINNGTGDLLDPNDCDYVVTVHDLAPMYCVASGDIDYPTIHCTVLPTADELAQEERQAAASDSGSRDNARRSPMQDSEDDDDSDSEQWSQSDTTLLSGLDSGSSSHADDTDSD